MVGHHSSDGDSNGDQGPAVLAEEGEGDYVQGAERDEEVLVPQKNRGEMA